MERSHPLKSRFGQHGFTLIELVVTVAIVAILAAVALPSYRQYIIKGNRAAAQAQMMEIANREQQYFLANRGYADTSTLESNGYSLPSEVSPYYSYSVSADNTATPPAYTITFTAISTQASDGNLTLTSAGVKSPASKW